LLQLEVPLGRSEVAVEAGKVVWVSVGEEEALVEVMVMEASLWSATV